VDAIHANCDAQPLNDLNNQIRKLAFVEGLETIRKLAFSKDRVLGGGTYPWNTLFSTRNQESQLTDIYQFELDYLSKSLLLFGDPNRSCLPSFHTFRSFVNVLKDINLPYINRTDFSIVDGWPLPEAQAFSRSIILMQTVWQQMFFQNNWALRFYRYEKMFQSHVPIGATSISDVIAHEFGVDWATLSKFALATMIIARSNYSPLDLAWYDHPQYRHTTFLNRTVVQQILHRLSWDNLNDFRDNYYNSPFRDDEKMLYDYNPLWTRPFVRHKDKWLMPIPSYLIRGITEALVYDLRNKLGGAFGHVFGTSVFQEYVHDVLTRRPDVQVTNMDAIKRLKAQKRCDFVVFDGHTTNTNLYVECKASTPTLNSRLGRYADIKKEAKRIADALEQCVLTQKMVADGTLGEVPAGPQELFLIVAMEEHYLFDVDPFLENFVNQELAAKGITLTTAYRVVGIETLEQLVDLTPPHKFMPQLISAFASGNPLVFELNRLNLLPFATSLAFQHVMTRLNDISQELFGRDLDAAH